MNSCSYAHVIFDKCVRKTYNGEDRKIRYLPAEN
jgi:hypothetical protein